MNAPVSNSTSIDTATKGDETTQLFALLPQQSSVRFRTRHVFGLFSVTGSVTVRAGSALVDVRDRSLLAVQAVLDMSSFASASTARDRVVASPRLLDSSAHPEATYRSTGVEPRDGGWLVHGELTVKARTAPVDLLVHHHGGSDGREHITATALVDRTRHGITVPSAMAAKQLQISIDAHAQPSLDA